MDKKYYIHLCKVHETLIDLNESDVYLLVTLCKLYDIDFNISVEMSEKELKEIME